MLADEVELVVGVDTHRDTHTLAFLEAQSAGLIEELAISADVRGYRRALAAARRLAPARAWAIEGTGSYGAGLRRHLMAQGERVIEIDRPERRGERHADKSDSLDAIRAARLALRRPHALVPRADGRREALRVLLVARQGAVTARTDAIRRLRALIVSAPESLREHLRGSSGERWLARCARARSRPGQEPGAAASRQVIGLLAREALSQGVLSRRLQAQIAEHVRTLAPTLLEQPGIGPISAAQLVVGYSHPGRIRNEAAFARLCGVAPIQASSGQVRRHRLDRGGDRQLNKALHMIVLSRRLHDPQTQAYIARRRSEGKSTREAVRCLKRYLARQVFRLLESTMRT